LFAVKYSNPNWESFDSAFGSRRHKNYALLIASSVPLSRFGAAPYLALTSGASIVLTGISFGDYWAGGEILKKIAEFISAS
jgi:hypothetical protein